MLRIVQVSDTHLSPLAPYADQNWERVVEDLLADPPDLVVHTGDVTRDGASDPSELDHARALLDAVPVPWMVIPGNHDIGDVGELDDVTIPVTEERQDRFRDRFGELNWSVLVGGYRLIGVDVQGLLDGVPTRGTWDWLGGELSRGDAPVALFLHRPLRPFAASERDSPHRYITEPTRARLEGLLAGTGVILVASGHVHQWRQVPADGVMHVWAPATWASLPERIQPTIGAKVVGVVEHVFADAAVTSTLRTPPGVAQVVIGDDFPSPYSH